jgi:hypothetical protein
MFYVVPRIVARGDEDKASSMVGRAMLELSILKNLMGFQSLKTMDRRVDFDDGSYIFLRSDNGIDIVEIFGAPSEKKKVVEEEEFYGPLVYVAVTYPELEGRCIVWDPLNNQLANAQAMGGGPSGFPCSVSEMEAWLETKKSVNSPLYKPVVAGNEIGAGDLYEEVLVYPEGVYSCEELACSANQDASADSEIADADGNALSNTYEATESVYAVSSYEEPEVDPYSTVCVMQKDFYRQYVQEGRKKRRIKINGFWVAAYGVDESASRVPGLGTYRLVPKNFEGFPVFDAILRQRHVDVWEGSSKGIDIVRYVEGNTGVGFWSNMQRKQEVSVQLLTPIGTLEAVEFSKFRDDEAEPPVYKRVWCPIKTEWYGNHRGGIWRRENFPLIDDVAVWDTYSIWASSVTDDHPDKTCTGVEFIGSGKKIYWNGTDWVRYTDEEPGAEYGNYTTYNNWWNIHEQAVCRACFMGVSYGYPVVVQIYFDYFVREESEGEFEEYPGIGWQLVAWNVVNRERILRIAAHASVAAYVDVDPRTFERNPGFEAAIKELIEDFESFNGIGSDEFVRFRTTVKILDKI